jgi:hypothetical protein
VSALLGNPLVTLPTTSSTFTVSSHGIAGSYLARPSLFLSSFLNFITGLFSFCTLLKTHHMLALIEFLESTSKINLYGNACFFFLLTLMLSMLYMFNRNRTP